MAGSAIISTEDENQYSFYQASKRQAIEKCALTVACLEPVLILVPPFGIFASALDRDPTFDRIIQQAWFTDRRDNLARPVLI